MDMTPKEKAELIFRSMVVDMSIDAEQSLMCAIKGVRGEFYPCKPDIFEMTYELLY